MMIQPLENGKPEIARKIAELQRKSYTVEARLIGFDKIPPLLELPEDILRCTESFLGCYRDGRLAGLLSYEREGTSVEICRVAVDPGCFRQGIGGALLQYLEDMYPDADRFYVSTALGNIPAINLYKRQGYTRESERKTEEGLTLITLVKNR